MTSSDALDDRKAAAQVTLERAVGAGKLTLDEFTERVDRVWRTGSAAEVEAALADLPAPIAVPGQVGGRISTSSIFDDVRRSGRFALRSGSKVSSFFGDVKLDLRQAVISEAEIQLHTSSFFGDIIVTVPKGVEVEVSSFRIFGTEQLDLIEAERLPGSPMIRISAWTIFGDVKVRNQGWSERLGQRIQRYLGS